MVGCRVGIVLGFYFPCTKIRDKVENQVRVPFAPFLCSFLGHTGTSLKLVIYMTVLPFSLLFRTGVGRCFIFTALWAVVLRPFWTLPFSAGSPLPFPSSQGIREEVVSLGSSLYFFTFLTFFLAFLPFSCSSLLISCSCLQFSSLFSYNKFCFC